MPPNTAAESNSLQRLKRDEGVKGYGLRLDYCGLWRNVRTAAAKKLRSGGNSDPKHLAGLISNIHPFEFLPESASTNPNGVAPLRKTYGCFAQTIAFS